MGPTPKFPWWAGVLLFLAAVFEEYWGVFLILAFIVVGWVANSLGCRDHILTSPETQCRSSEHTLTKQDDGSIWCLCPEKSKH